MEFCKFCKSKMDLYETGIVERNQRMYCYICNNCHSYLDITKNEKTGQVCQILRWDPFNKTITNE